MYTKELVKNRRAYYDYEILDTFECGISLTGTEVKSLKNHGGSLQDAYVTIKDLELYLLNASIAPYSFGNIYNHEEKRKRKLLLHKLEIEKLIRKTQEKQMALIPLSIYIKNRWIKVKIAIAKGKKKYDKRSKLKEEEQKKAVQRALKE